MKTARHVATGKIVDASQVGYDDYFGIFECPQCKAALTLRKGYTRSDGIAIGAAFVHPANGTEEQVNCFLRIDLKFDSSNSFFLNNSLNRGQVYKLLKSNLLRCLKDNSRVSILEYYQEYGNSSNIELRTVSRFVNISSSVLKLPQNDLYLYNQIENIKKLILNRKANTIYQNHTENSDKLTLEDINRVIWGI